MINAEYLIECWKNKRKLKKEKTRETKKTRNKGKGNWR
jgi:hypothetical protein